MLITAAIFSQLRSSCPSSRRRYVVAVARLLWSRKRDTSSTDSPASRLSFAAECLKMWTPPGGRPAFLATSFHVPEVRTANDTPRVEVDGVLHVSDVQGAALALPLVR